MLTRLGLVTVIAASMTILAVVSLVSGCSGSFDLQYRDNAYTGGAYIGPRPRPDNLEVLQ